VVKGNVMPLGSVVLLSSLSHLKAVGLEAYCVDMVQAVDSVWQRFRSGVTTMHGLPIVNAEVKDKPLINNLVNVLKWYGSVLPKRARSLKATGELLLKDLLKAPEKEDLSEGERRRLPRSLMPNAGGAVFTTCGYGVTSDMVGRTSQSDEAVIVKSMLNEANDLYNLGLATEVNLDRKVTTNSGVAKNVWHEPIVMVVGASHADCIASVLEEEELTVINLARSGWRVTPESVEEKRKEVIAELARSPSTATIIFMCLDNNAYFGSTNVGTKELAKRDNGGRYHIEGRLAVADKKDIMELVYMLNPILQEVRTLQKVFITPLPRYLNGKCCGKDSHVSNCGNEGYQAMLMDVAADFWRWARDCLHKQKVSGVRVVNPCEAAGLADGEQARRLEGTAAWDEDNVHLSSHAYVTLGIEIAKIVRGQLDLAGSAPRAARRHEAEAGTLGPHGRPGRRNP